MVMYSGIKLVVFDKLFALIFDLFPFLRDNLNFEIAVNFLTFKQIHAKTCKCSIFDAYMHVKIIFVCVAF